ncbi:MAG: octaprenyl diphosphate synthase [Gammaproteobacteria bacterium]|nr:octaprenyl diphosphate synthase [Gammaproteobacteria bacterium]MDH3408117.1 octaprenyl diphosphate synthase [Gammaproteobacteria bacterium]
MQILMHAVDHSPDIPAFDDAVALARDGMQAVDRLISKSLESDVALVSQVSQYIVTSGGKRLRPLLVLLAARALGYDGEQHIRSAAIIEFIHTATLLHDDVVDSSARRRGKDTANTVFGNQASVLVGDFLYSRAFQMMVDMDSMRVMQILADATNTIAAGEVMQLMNVHDPDTSEEAYRQVIYRKTARLFEAGAQIAAVLANRDPGDEAAMITYGQNLGAAFQLIDDALDFNASAAELGKNLGDDLAEGKATLPLIYAMQNGSAEDKELIRNAIVEGGLGQLDKITTIIESTGALQYTAARAQEAADTAIAALSDVPDSDYKRALIAIADFSVQRRS